MPTKYSIEKPARCFICQIPDGLKVGHKIKVIFEAPENHGNSFGVDLVIGNTATKQFASCANIALRVKARVDKGTFVMNSRIDGQWGVEIRQPDWIIKKFQANTIQIIVNDEHFEVVVNGRALDFRHRIASEDVGVLDILGTVPVSVINISTSFADGLCCW